MSIVKHRRGSTERWNEADPVIERGEIILEYCEDGSVKLKAGNDDKFSNTPYIQGTNSSNNDNSNNGGNNVTDEQITAINERIDTIDNSITDLTDRVEILENTENNSGSVDLTDLTERVESLEAIDINTKLESTTNSITDLTTRVETLENTDIGSIESINERLSSVEKENDVLESRMDTFVALEEGSITSDLEELVDIRVGYDNQIHESAGKAVRSLGNELKYLKENLEDFIDADAVDGLHYDTTTHQLYLTSNGETVGNSVTIVGGGGGSAGYDMRLMNKMSSSELVVPKADQTLIKAEFYENYNGVSTGVNGILEVSYKLNTDSEWIFFRKLSVVQGIPFSVDVASILTQDVAIDVQFKVTGGESNETRPLTFTITQVEASISTINFNSAALYTGNIYVQYKCIGRNLAKTVYFEIDGEVFNEINVGTSHNTILSHTIEMIGNFDYGVHDLKIYFKTEDGATSNVLSNAILYDNGNGIAPMVGVITNQTEYNYGDLISLNYVVYTPNQETTDELYIKVYSINDNGEEVTYGEIAKLVDITNNVLCTWTGTSYPPSGKVYIEFTSKETVKTVELEINEIQSEYDLKPVTTNLVYSYSANSRTNNDANKEIYNCNYKTANGVTTSIKGKFTGFNWVSNGYVDSESLTLTGDARHTIELPMFSTSYIDEEGQNISLEAIADSTVTTNGRTFEIEFKVSNVTDVNAHIIKCMSNDHAGFVITPQTCYLLAANGKDVQLDSTGFIENEESIAAAYLKDNTRIRVSFVIQPKGSISYVNDSGETITGQCVNIYINGQYANSYVYPDNARFVSTEYITMGSNTCIIKVYDVRIYNRGLNENEILQNYKCSPAVVTDRIVRSEDNDMLTDDNTDIDYYKAITKYPCLLVTGELSPYKGNKKKAGNILTKPDGNGGYVTELYLMDKDSDGKYVCNNNVQGTSSQKFPVKNYKFSFARINPEDGSTVKVKYSLKGVDENGNPLSIPESTLCWKADFMSSDHANTFNANLADTLFKDTLPSQREDPRVQNTIYGFRCLLFRRDSEDGQIYFAGDGALNNDKGNSKTFGLECDDDKDNITTRQKWEFLNNTEALCSFQTDHFYELVESEGKQVKRVVLGLESMYPDQGDLEKAGLEPVYDYLQVLFTWVYQRANFWDASTDPLNSPYVYKGVNYYTEHDYRKAIFKEEFTKHFNLNHALVYYLFMEFVALCDNRAKNMFLKCENVYEEKLLSVYGSEISIHDLINKTTGEVNANLIDWENSSFAIWYTDLYDLDSCFGVENSGYMQIPYYADWHYHLNNTQKFNGRESRLWLMFEEAFASEVEAKAQTLVDVDDGSGLNYESLYNMHIRDNAKLVCSAIVNRDMTYKYEDPWIDGFIDYSTEGYPVRHISDYKYLQRGSRTEQKDAFIYRRSNMLYSKYKCKKFLNNNINFRCGTNGGVPATNSGITIAANQTLYPAVKFGDGDAAVISGIKTDAGVNCVVTKPGSASTDKVGFSDTVYIAGGTFLTDIGDISKFRPYELQLQNATGLRRLIIGSSEEGYQNVQLKNIDTAACTLLEELNVMGCTSLGTLDLSKNGILKKLYATNSSVQSVTLPTGGVIEELYLGDIVDLEILHQTNLKVFECSSYNKLNRLHIENTPNIPVLSILMSYLPQLTGGIRIVGLDETFEDDSFVKLLLSDDAKGKYIDPSGTHIDDANRYSHIEGNIYVPTIRGTDLKKMKVAYPDLTITYDTLVATITYMNDDGTEKLYENTIYNKNNAPDIIANGMFSTPTKASTAQYDFTYGGWTREVNGDPDEFALRNIDEDITVYIAYYKAIKSYTINFYNGNILKYSVITKYGDDAIYAGDIPEKLDTNNPDLYDFAGWQPKPEAITGAMNCYAQFYFTGTEDTVYQFVLSDFNYSKSIDSNGNKYIVINSYIGTETIGRILPSYEIDGTYAVTTIKADAFNYEIVGADLEAIYLPNSITTIGSGAFSKCSNLSIINLPTKLTRIENMTFTNCKSITELTIPDGVTEIGGMGLYGCGFYDIYIPSKVTTIGMYAFKACENLTEVTFAPDINYRSLSINNSAFAECNNLKVINVPWSKGDVSGESIKWGATNATINYNYAEGN